MTILLSLGNSKNLVIICLYKDRCEPVQLPKLSQKFFVPISGIFKSKNTQLVYYHVQFKVYRRSEKNSCGIFGFQLGGKKLKEWQKEGPTFIRDNQIILGTAMFRGGGGGGGTQVRFATDMGIPCSSSNNI